MPSVSVIIPVYNVEPYIARCVRSLFGQTLQDIEFIFIDDCSPDNSMGVMNRILEEEFPYRIPQVKLFRMPKNSGQAKVRMQGMSMATGEYVIHCDSDDEVDRDAYRLLYEMAVAEKADIVTCDYNKVYLDGRIECRSQFSKKGEEVSDILFARVWGTLWCRLISLQLLRDIVPPVGDMCEDMVIVCQTICRAHRICYISMPLYSYHVRSSSISHLVGDYSIRKGILANASLLTRLLQDRYSFSEKNPAIVFYKYYNRMFLHPRVQIPKYYMEWRSIFPEIDRYFLLIPGISFQNKFFFLLIHLHLYYPWKLLTNNIRKCLATIKD